MEPYCTSLINRRIPYWRPLASSESITAFKFLYWKFNIHFSENKFPSMVNDFPSPLNILESRGKTLLTINSSQWGACLWIHAKIQNISLAEHFITKWLTICIRQLRTVLPLLGLKQREMTKISPPLWASVNLADRLTSASPSTPHVSPPFSAQSYIIVHHALLPRWKSSPHNQSLDSGLCALWRHASWLTAEPGCALGKALTHSQKSDDVLHLKWWRISQMDSWLWLAIRNGGVKVGEEGPGIRS